MENKPFNWCNKKAVLLRNFTQQYRFFLLLMLCSFGSVAQFVRVPLANQTVNKANQARITALSLPFFEDFSTTTGSQQNLQRWQAGGGVLINNTLPINQPTVNVATFDGLKANGFPYDFTNKNADGATDTLTSLPINLKTDITVADSLYLSFYWQGKGRGEQPDPVDSLQLQFLTNGGLWKTVWIQKGVNTNGQFKQAVIPIRATVYLHESFQFRFRAFGRQSGNFDSWHLDYIYLNKNRRVSSALFSNDIACSTPISAILKRYTAMPLMQLLVNPARELADSVTFRVHNLDQGFDYTGYNYYVKNANSKDTLQKQIVSSVGVEGNSFLDIKLPNTIAKSLTGNKLNLKVGVLLTTTDGLIDNVNLKMNDSINSFVTLDNYYAYDDGTAEQGAYLTKGFGRAAVQFINNKPDVVSAIRINLQPSLINIAGNAITVQVMDNDKGKPGKVMRGFYTKIQYSDKQNGFIEYPIDPVAVKDTFYVGYLQLTDDEPIIVGLDNNTPQFVHKHFYNVSNEWVNASKSDTNTFRAIRGSLMIRPVMGGTVKTEITLGTEEEIQNRNLQLFPNPTNDVIRWNDNSLKNVEIIDLSGKSIIQQKVEQTEISLSTLNSGMYLLRLSNERNTFVRRIWITH
jgi:hypothetical protein